AWLPFLLLCWDQFLEQISSENSSQFSRSRDLLWSACLFGLILLAGSPQIAILAAFLLLGWIFLCGRSANSLRAILWLFFVAGVGFLLSGVAVMPCLFYLEHASRVDPNLAQAIAGSLPARCFLSVFVPALPSLSVPDQREFSIYLGTFTPILIAAVCCVRLPGKTAGQRWLFVLSALLMLGGSSGLWHALYAFCPPFRQIRIPAQFSVVWTISGALLAGYGLERLAELKREAHRLLKWIIAVTGVILLAVSLAAITVYFFRQGISKQIFDDVDRLSLTAVLLGLNLLVLILWYQRAIRPRAFVFLIAALAALDLSGQYLDLDTKPKNENSATQQPKVLDWFDQQPRPFRVSLNNHAHKNLGLLRSIETIDGYAVLQPESTDRLLSNLSKDRALDLFGVNWVLSNDGQDAMGPIVHRQDGIAIQENKSVLPRYWVVYRVVWASRDEVYREIERIDPETEGVLLDQDREYIEPLLKQIQSPPWGSPEARIEIVEYRPERRVEIEADLPTTGILIASDPEIPGWTASVDQYAVKTFPIHGGLRGIVVPAGKHVVVYRYSPPGILLGLGMTALGTLLLLLLWRSRNTG
ncbi:MAG: hypothetical protein ABIH23_20815, partial [bacterium]